MDDRIQNLEEELNTMRQKNEAIVTEQKGNRGLMSECSEIKEKTKHLEDIKNRSAIIENCLKKYAVQASLIN